jgi:hypothetical protein
MKFGPAFDYVAGGKLPGLCGAGALHLTTTGKPLRKSTEHYLVTFCGRVVEVPNIVLKLHAQLVSLCQLACGAASHAASVLRVQSTVMVGGRACNTS